jgi:MYXO-CTERM domain-containing protein
VAVGASCVIPVTFAPSAPGIRTTTLTIADDAASSPQLVTVNGTAVTAVSIAAAAGATLSASVSAGQTAQFNLQAMPAAGFSGSLVFACSGAPTGANCSAPGITVANGAPVNFTVTVTTSGTAGVGPGTPRNIPSPPPYSPIAATLLLLLLAIAAYRRSRRRGEISVATLAWKRLAATSCLAILLNGCGGGGGGSVASSVQQPPPPGVTTPSGTYTLTVAPSVTPAGSTKSFPLSPISLTLVVK